ncbi:hypothetical protein EJ07DRAFT_31139, partial [Lizonia empirigonia]
YSVRKQLLQELSAYDAAKLEIVLGRFLDCRERNVYLNPIRDLMFSLTEVRALETCGMRFVLLGNDIFALRRRLEDPQQYIRKHGHTRKLQIYLVGYCPAIAKTTRIRDKLLGFSLLGAPSADSVVEDIIQMDSMNDLSPDPAFILSLGASSQSSGHFARWRCVPNTPDSTIDLRIYVPSVRDRQRQVIKFSKYEAWHLS